MKLQELKLNDRALVDKFLKIREHELSVYSFENILMCSPFYKIEFCIQDDALSVFYKDKFGIFMILPPLTEKIKSNTIENFFALMDQVNSNKRMSRIENIEQIDAQLFKEMGYKLKTKFCDYLYKRQKLVDLKGDSFKSKRADVNFFAKNYKFNINDFNKNNRENYYLLFEQWENSRKISKKDSVYTGMLEDSRKSFQFMMDNFGSFNLKGIEVIINSDIKGFTLGYELNKSTFCILYEVVDLNVKGLSQFIFKKFCEILKGYEFINVMDDSGLENLKRVKQSYNPIKEIPNYIVQRANA